MNRVVFSQLSLSTVDGIAHHLVKRHKSTRDVHSARNSLCDWYDWNTVKNKNAERLRIRLDRLKLRPGISASNYINQFLSLSHELQKIPGEEFLTSHIIYLFIRNIEDPEYRAIVTYLRNKETVDLQECVKSVRKNERDILERKSERGKSKNVTRRYKEQDDSEQIEDVHSRRLKGEIETNQYGYIRVPYNTWTNLDQDNKSFVQKYNAKV